jgi:hypothetical protein
VLRTILIEYKNTDEFAKELNCTPMQLHHYVRTKSNKLLDDLHAGTVAYRPDKPIWSLTTRNGTEIAKVAVVPVLHASRR